MTSVDELIGAPVKPSHAAVAPGKDEPTSPVERLAKLAWAPKRRGGRGAQGVMNRGNLRFD